MDSPEFKPFELKDFDSEVSVQEAAAVETCLLYTSDAADDL